MAGRPTRHPRPNDRVTNASNDASNGITNPPPGDHLPPSSQTQRTMNTRAQLGRFAPVAIVGIGGFVGANLRFLSVETLDPMAGILLANIVGSLILGFLVYEGRTTDYFGRHSRLLLTTGFCSSLTTYSGFAYYTATGDPALSAVFVVSNYVLAIGAVLVGRQIALALGGERTTTAGGVLE